MRFQYLPQFAKHFRGLCLSVLIDAVEPAFKCRLNRFGFTKVDSNYVWLTWRKDKRCIPLRLIVFGADGCSWFSAVIYQEVNKDGALL